MSDVTFTTAHLVVLGAVLGPMAGAIGILFRALLASKDQAIKVSADALEDALLSNKELSAAVKEATTELRELRSDLWRERAIGSGREGRT